MKAWQFCANMIMFNIILLNVTEEYSVVWFASAIASVFWIILTCVAGVKEVVE